MLPELSFELLHKLYVVDKLSAKYISTKLGCSYLIVLRDLRLYGIVTKSSRQKLVLDKSELYRLYVTEGMTTDAIAKRFGCSQTAVVNNMQRYNIPARLKTDHLLGTKKPEHGAHIKALWNDGCYVNTVKLGSDHYNWKGGRKQTYCSYCNKPISIRPSKLKGYCSTSCSAFARELGGANNPNWRGGLSFEPYPETFNRKFKQMIRDRDGNHCQLCYAEYGFITETRSQQHCVHHIDYVKGNTIPKNCITLCHSCNSRVNFDRWFWSSLLAELLEYNLCNQHSSQMHLPDIFNLQTNVI